LATIGLNVPAGKLADWLVLVPVFALELGAALSAVLVQSISGPSSERQTTPTASFDTERRLPARSAQRGSASEPVESPDPDPRPDPNKPPKRTHSKPGKRTKRDAQKRLGNVVRLVRENGGKITASQQTLANRLHLSKTRTHELLRELEDAGHVELSTSRDGTTVRLIA
jgi:uncharacterized membrane protein